MDKKILHSFMITNGDTQGKLAEAMGMARSTLNAKINETGGREFTLSEISFIRQRYDLTPEQVELCFFTS